jgi:hypothetical protein
MEHYSLKITISPQYPHMVARHQNHVTNTDIIYTLYITYSLTDLFPDNYKI